MYLATLIFQDMLSPSASSQAKTPLSTLTPGSSSRAGISSDDGDMASMSPEDAAAAARLRKIACVECRQQKVF